jgi:lambda repressor-like predicted transcriptional regulator
MVTGAYSTRAALIAGVKALYDDGATMREIAERAEVSANTVRNLIVAGGWSRTARSVVTPTPMSVKPHELRFVRSPCQDPLCRSARCPHHAAAQHSPATAL